MQFLLTIHSIIRWIIILVGLVAIVRFALVWARRMEASKADRGLMSGFSGLLDTQALIGIVYILWLASQNGGFQREWLEHAGTMIVAVVVGHVPMRWRNAEGTIRARNNLLDIVVVLVLVVIGVSFLRGGWTR